MYCERLGPRLLGSETHRIGEKAMLRPGNSSFAQTGQAMLMKSALGTTVQSDTRDCRRGQHPLIMPTDRNSISAWTGGLCLFQTSIARRRPASRSSKTVFSSPAVSQGDQTTIADMTFSLLLLLSEGFCQCHRPQLPGDLARSHLLHAPGNGRPHVCLLKAAVRQNYTGKKARSFAGKPQQHGEGMQPF